MLVLLLPVEASAECTGQVRASPGIRDLAMSAYPEVAVATLSVSVVARTERCAHRPVVEARARSDYCRIAILYRRLGLEQNLPAGLRWRRAGNQSVVAPLLVG